MKNAVQISIFLDRLEKYREMLKILETEKNEAEKALELLKDNKDLWVMIKRPFILRGQVALCEISNRRFSSLDGMNSLIQEVEEAIETEEWNLAFKKAEVAFICLEDRRSVIWGHSVQETYDIFVDKVKDLRDFLRNTRFAISL